MKKEKNELPFSKQNYKIMLLGIVVLVLGLVIMKLDTEPHGFGFLGLTLGPIIVLIGFIIEFWAIFATSKKDSKE